MGTIAVPCGKCTEEEAVLSTWAGRRVYKERSSCVRLAIEDPIGCYRGVKERKLQTESGHRF